MSQRFHRVAEDVAGGCLNDVLDKLGTVGFKPLPFLCASDSLVSDTGCAELVCADLGLYVCEVSAGWKGYKEHSAFIGEENTVRFCRRLILNGFLDSRIDSPPKVHDVGVGITPSGNKGLKLVFSKPHFDSTHRFQGTDRTAVSKGKFCDFSFLS